MTVTRTNKGRFNIYTSDASTTANVVSDLVQALDDEGVHAEDVIYFNTTDKIAIARR
ncbi:MAG: hypothetical protein ACTSWZ_01625 [Candidatus Heimdallarchaeaceae archaeon]